LGGQETFSQSAMSEKEKQHKEEDEKKKMVKDLLNTTL